MKRIDSKTDAKIENMPLVPTWMEQVLTEQAKNTPGLDVTSGVAIITHPAPESIAEDKSQYGQAEETFE